MTSHEDKIARVAREVRERVSRGAPVRFAKASVSHFVPNPFAIQSNEPRIDLSDLCELLSIDPERRIAVAEPGLTFARLVEETLRHGLVPATVPELEGITVGGAVSGCSLESMSYRYGGFHDRCLAYEVLTATGDVLSCSRDQDPELFHMIHGSYGTLGVLTKATFELVPGKPFVRMEYHRFGAVEPFFAFLRERCDQGGQDFVDAIVHAPDCFVVCLGTMVDAAPETSRYDWRAVYYQSTRERTTDFLRTRDYFFRYDTECHWLTRTVPGLEHRALRFLVGRWLLGSTNLITWSKRLAPLLRLMRRPDVVVDVFIPARNFERFYRWYEREFDYWPLWIVPYRMPERYPWLTDECAERLGDFAIDCAIYGKRNGRRDVDYSELLERKVLELDGVKTLISRNHYDRATFDRIYSRPRWEAAKRRTDPRNALGDLYEKMHPRSARIP